MKNISYNTFKLIKSLKYNSTFNKSDLKKRLSPLEYNVTQEKGTERPFTGEYWDNKDTGIYSCIVCDNELFKLIYLITDQIINLIQEQDGHHFTKSQVN
jgi:hypothetical protein